MQTAPSNYTRYYAQSLVEDLVKAGIKYFFVSPGMRNSPLIWAITNNQEAIIIDGIDERAHAFRALGLAKSTGQSTCLVCTSGTALSNYFPAVIESYKTGSNLVILSADRPPHLVKGNANQTIEQNNFYGSFTGAEYYHHCENNQASYDTFKEKTHELLLSLDKTGALHFNLAFEEPLDHNTTEIRIDQIVKTQTIPKDCTQNFELPQLTEDTLFVVGDNLENKQSLLEAVKSLDFNFYLDITSNIKTEKLTNSIPSFDHPEVYQYFSNNPPKTIVHLGGRVTSKQYYQYLADNTDINLITVNTSHLNEDPALRKNQYIKSSIINFLQQLAKSNINFTPAKRKQFFEFIDKKEIVIESEKLSYPFISKKSVELLKENINLVIGNSTFIRSFDYYASYKTTKQFNIISNRGASGIEGLLATAQGVSLNEKPTVLFIGDISLIHDLNSLINWQKYSTPLLIVCANNKGGGIFDLLPIAKDKKILKHMTTEPDINFEPICQSVGMNYLKIPTKDSFISALENWNKYPTTCFLDINFSREDNINVYQKLRTINL